MICGDLKSIHTCQSRRFDFIFRVCSFRWPIIFGAMIFGSIGADAVYQPCINTSTSMMQTAFLQERGEVPAVNCGTIPSIEPILLPAALHYHAWNGSNFVPFLNLEPFQVAKRSHEFEFFWWLSRCPGFLHWKAPSNS